MSLAFGYLMLIEAKRGKRGMNEQLSGKKQRGRKLLFCREKIDLQCYIYK